MTRFGAEAAGWTVLPLGQVDCGRRVVALLWPAIAPNGAVAVDDDVVGVAFERTPDGRLVSLGRLDVRGPEDVGCGDVPLRVRRGRAGVPRAQIAVLLGTRVNELQRAAASGDRAAFAAAVLGFAELFGDVGMFEGFTDAMSNVVRDQVTVVAATLVPAGLAVRARSADHPDRVEEEELRLVPVPGGDDLVVIDLSR